MRPDGPRDPTAGPDSGPEQPFPLRLDGEVIKGFGRGSKEVRSLSQLFASPAGWFGLSQSLDYRHLLAENRLGHDEYTAMVDPQLSI